MEVWTLEHPRHGLIELRQGFDTEFLAEDPGWPHPEQGSEQEGPEQQGPEHEALEQQGTEEVAPSSSLGLRPAPDASLGQRVRARLRNPPLRLQVRVDGEVTGRYPRTGVDEVRLKNPKTREDGFSAMGESIARNIRRLKVRSNALGEIHSVQFRDASTVVEFDPPPGSRGARRQAAMESSCLKRVLYPFLGGLGKAGGVILFLVLLPMLAQLLPDWEVDLPEFRLPQIHLPVSTIPQIALPVPTWPSWEIDLPPLPEWVIVVLEHDHLWKPVLIGLGIGIMAVLNHRRSEKEKARWKQEAAGRPETQA